MNIEEFLRRYPKPWSNICGKHVYDATGHYVNVDQLLEYITELEEHYKKVTINLSAGCPPEVNFNEQK